MQKNAINRKFRSFFLQHDIKTHSILESGAGDNYRQLIHYKRLHELKDEVMSACELGVELVGHHLSIITSMIEHKITGQYDIELTLSGLLNHSDFYADIVGLARKSGIIIKVHIVLGDDDAHANMYTDTALKQQIAPIIAAQVPFAIENIDCIENAELMHLIIELIEEIRVDLANNGAANLTLIQEMLDRVIEDSKTIEQYVLPLTSFDGSILSYRVTKN